MLGRRPRVLLKALALVGAAALVCGILYEQFGRRQDRRRLRQIGRSVAIGGRTLNIFCSGNGHRLERSGPLPENQRGSCHSSPMPLADSKITAGHVDSAHEDEPLRAPKFALTHTAPRFLWHPLDLAFRSAALVGLIPNAKLFCQLAILVLYLQKRSLRRFVKS
jgi:hypothetical protein